MGSNNRRRAALFCTMMLVGSSAQCAPDEIKDIISDKLGYLDKKFNTKQIPKKVAAAITKVDSGPLDFKKVVVVMIPEVELPSTSNAGPRHRITVTFINSGGPFVRALEEISGNDLPISIDYNFSYRGIALLRQQHMKLNGRWPGYVHETKSIEEFSALPDLKAGGSGMFVIRRHEGTDPSRGNHLESKITCQLGAVTPASEIHKQFSGNAQLLQCESSNNNGVVIGRSRKAFLLDYGFAIVIRNEAANFTTNFKVVEASVE